MTKKITYLILILLVSFTNSFAQTTTFSTGSFIINMGVVPQTANNALRPYGLIYDLLKNNRVPVNWVINQSKVKDGEDFSHNGVSYKGGTFILAKEFITAAITAKFNSYGVTYATTNAPLTVNVTHRLTAAPVWTLDDQNGKIAASWFPFAGVPATAYNWKNPQLLDGCDDIFVMPHADPTWSTHSNLYNWNRNNFGAIWAGCHAVSVLENMHDGVSKQTNFLANNVGGLGNALVLWSSHKGGTPPYVHQHPSATGAQYMGVTDNAHLNGSEQIFLAKKGGSWRSTTRIIAYDPTPIDPSTLYDGPATIIAWGRGFGLNTSGWVMYEAAHNIGKTSTDAASIAAMRAFWDFSFVASQDKVPFISAASVASPMIINQNNNVSITANSPVGLSFTYRWTATLNGVPAGSFACATCATTTFRPTTAGDYVITCSVTDQCGKTSFSSTGVKVNSGPSNPTVVADVATLNLTCGESGTVTTNVLSNDSNPDGGSLSINSTPTLNSPAKGTLTYTSGGNITFNSFPGVSGTQVINYTATNSNNLSSTTTLTITIGSGTAPTANRDAFTIAEDSVRVFNVLSNDANSNSISSFFRFPINGRASISINNRITYIPNRDFSGNDSFVYVAVNAASGLSDTALVRVTITDDGCASSGQYARSGGASISTLQAWRHIRTRTGSNNASNTDTSNNAYTINSGSNRLLVVGVEVSVNEANVAPSTKTVSWGGKSLTFLSSNPAAGNRVFAYLYILKESDIATASGNRLIVSMGGGKIYGFVTFAAVYQNVNQSSTLRRAGDSLVSTTADAVTASTIANFTAGDQGIFIAAFGDNGANTNSYSSVSSGWTGSSSLFAGSTGNGGAFYGGIGTRSGTSSASGETVSMTAGTSMRRSMSVVSLIPNSATCVSIPTRAPLANPDDTTVVNGNTITLPTVPNDFFITAGTRTYALRTSPSNGSASINSSGVITFNSNNTFNGTVTFQYTVSVGGLVDTGLVSITILNGPIVANNDASSGNANSVQTIDVITNDTDPEGQVTNSTVTISTAPKKGTATVNGSKQVVYTPLANYTGNDTLFYTICEPNPACGNPQCSTARVIMTMSNTPPAAIPDTVPVLACTSKIIDLLVNDTDAEGNNLSVFSIGALSNPSAGSLVNNGDGTVTFTPVGGLSLPLSLSFAYVVTDDGVPPLKDTITVILNITNPATNNAPVAMKDNSDIIYFDQLLLYDILQNDSDPDNNILGLPTITRQPRFGSATIQSNGILSYTPNGSHIGFDTLIYRVCDSTINANTCQRTLALCDTAIVYITLIPRPITVSGFVYNDVNGLNGSPSNTIDGTGIGTINSTPLYAYLVNGAGNVVDMAPVNSNGSFTFNDVVGGGATYSVRISTNIDTIGTPVTPVVLPTGWVSTGEFNGAGAGNDGTANGILPSITVNTNNISTLKLAVQELPTAATITAPSATNPGGTTTVAVPSTTFAGTDPGTGGSITSIRITSFPTNTTTLVVNGVSYTSGTFPGGGITVPTNASGEPTQNIAVDPTPTGATTVTINYVVRDIAGFESSNTGQAILPLTAAASISVTGRVFNDIDGSSNGINNLSGLGNPSGATLYANLLNSTGTTVIASVPVGINGTYTFNGVTASTTYIVQLSTNQGTPSSAAPAIALPDGWVNTGENLGSGTGNDGTANGLLTVAVGTGSITNANFGIEKRPIPFTETATSVVNPGGTTNSTIASTIFGASDEGTGTITSIRITSFPTNATSITINNRRYYADTAAKIAAGCSAPTCIVFPAGGIPTVTNNAGEPTTALLIDPIDGDVTVKISYTATDNAGVQSTVIGEANIPFYSMSIIGTVFNDADGLKNNIVDGTGLGNPNSTTLYANLLNGSNVVVARTTVNPNGTYTFTQVNPGTYSIQISTNQGTISSAAPATNLPTSWVPTGENLGATAGNDGNGNGILTGISVVDGDVIEANFGIDKLPVAYDKTYTNLSASLFSASSGNSNYPLKIDLNASSGTSDNAFNNSGNSSLLPGKLSGSDFEDGNYNGSTGGNIGTVVFTTLPNSNSSVLVYDGKLLIPSPSNSDPSYMYWNTTTNRYEIPDYNANLLSLYLKRQGPGQDSGFSFKYSYLDEAGKISNEATYLVKASSPLPVKLISFTANKLNDKQVILNWTTATEINNSHFEVQRSNDVKNWITLGSVQGNGTSNIIHKYSFIDAKPLNPANYYRLKQIDFNGEFEYTDIRLVQFNGINNQIIVYPNPVESEVTVSINGTKGTGNVIISLTDLTGRLIFQKSFDSFEGNSFSEKVQLENYDKGFYYLNVTDGLSTHTTKLFKY